MASLNILHFNNTNPARISDTLSIIPTSETKDAVVNSKTYKFKVSLSSLSYKKKIYEPHEAIAIVSITKTDSSTDIFPTADIIVDLFLGKSVSIDLDEAGVSTNLFIHKVVPKVKSGEIQLTLHIYSLDKLMTLDKYSQAYSGRKLRKELIASINRFEFSYTYYSSINTTTTQKVSVVADTNKTEVKTSTSQGTSTDTTQLQHLSDGYYKKQYTRDEVSYDYSVQNEFIHPYLVQYNESFYDFLVRVSNRCGEFLYFEEGVLKIGLDLTVDYSEKVNYPSDSAKTKKELYAVKSLGKITEITGYDEIDMSNSTAGVFTVESFHRNSLAEKNTISDSSSTANHPEVKGDYTVKSIYKDTGSEFNTTYPSDTNFNKKGYFYNSEIAHDEFFMPLYKDGFGGDKFVELDRGSAGKQISHAVDQVLNSTSLFELLSNAAIEYTSIGLLYGMYHNVMGDRGKERFIKPNAPSNTSNINNTTFTEEPNVVVPFSENKEDRWTTLEYYSDIKYFQEMQSRQMIKVNMASNLKNLKLGEIIKISALGSDYYVVTEVTTEITFGDTISKSQIFYAIPLLKFISKNATRYAAYPPVIEKEVFRKSGAQTAFVVDAADPKRQGRVRIRYPWQTNDDNIPEDSDISIPKEEEKVWNNYKNLKKEAASPWVRMVMPAASGGGSGIYFEAEPGDEVLVNFENDNVERPYVVGSLYSKNHLAPVAKGRRVLLSKFGHMIRFKDPSDGVGEISDSTGLVRVLSSFSPLLDTVSFWFGDLIPNWDATTSNADKLTGGIDIGDAFGMYSISTSSDERSIKIASPFGDISLSAFSGITIKAPNGNIKIEGKNIDLIASNKVNITSGVNLEKRSWWSGGLGGDTKGESFSNVAKAFGDKVFDSIIDKLKPIDFDLIRTLFEVVIRPVNGTLSLKSHSFILMEAGDGDAQIPRDAFTERYKKKVLETADTTAVVDAYGTALSYIDNLSLVIDTHYQIVTVLVDTINTMINKFVDDYINRNILSVDSRDALVDSLFNPQKLTYTFANLNQSTRSQTILSRLDDNDELDEEAIERETTAYMDSINNAFTSIHHLIHAPGNGLNEMMKLDYIKNNLTNWLGVETNPELLDLLNTHLTQTYNKSESYFAYCSNEDKKKSLFKNTGYTDSKAKTFLNQKKYLIRILIKKFFDDFNKNFPDFIVETGKITPTIYSDSSWNTYVKSIKIIRDRFPVTKYLRKKLGEFDNSFQESLSTWQDTPGGKGKIVFSDNKANSWHSDGNNNSFVKYNNRQKYNKEMRNTAKSHLIGKLTSL